MDNKDIFQLILKISQALADYVRQKKSGRSENVTPANEYQ